MLGKFKEGWDFLGPLTAHCLVHAVFTFAIVIWLTPVALALGLAGLDFVIHFIMDRLKAGPKYLGRFKTMTKEDFSSHEYAMGTFAHRAKTEKDPVVRMYNQNEEAVYKNKWQQKLLSNKLFWWSLGFDQMIHHLTHYLIVYIIIILGILS